MRGLKIASGIAVLVTSLHMVHGIHHMFGDHMPHDALGVGGLALAGIAVALSFVGGVLLIKPGN